MDRHTGPTRISENYLYALPLHGGDKDFGAIHRFTQRGGLTRSGRLFCSRGFHKRVGYYKGWCTGDQSLTAPSKKSTAPIQASERPERGPQTNHRDERQQAADDRHHDDVEIAFAVARVADRE